MSTSSNNDDFQESFNNAQDTFNSATKTISGAWIAGIVVIVVGVIAAAVIAIWFFRRSQRRRRQREKIGSDTSTIMNTYPSSYQSPHPAGQQQSQQQPQPMEQRGHSPWQEVPANSPPTLFEAQDTGVALGGAPNMATPTPMSSQYANGGPRTELSDIESGRRELP
ncbi:hypothetical protein SAMD00023353_0503100 [Rosellinia necatrix]|uniref:Uncharacterized protein n=1 Tax=Rosellinia necatrix TaxID=77044 RepID=A0A1S7UNE0_ROSNE|nr:hypothetical protein SAMD00023353_0503100 [Rosellinia necatrix]